MRAGGEALRGRQLSSRTTISRQADIKTHLLSFFRRETIADSSALPPPVATLTCGQSQIIRFLTTPRTSI